MTICGFFPPSSSETFFSILPATSAILEPTADEPVKEITPISGCEIIASPTLEPVPCTIFTTPFGTPASIIILTSSVAVAGVSEAGLKTTVFPSRSAGTIFQQGIAMGKFHGVIRPAIPTGFTIVYAILSLSSEGVVTPKSLLPSPNA